MDYYIKLMSYIHNNIIYDLLNQTKSLLEMTLYMILIIVATISFNYSFFINFIYDWQSDLKKNKVGKNKNEKQFGKTQKIKPH